MGTATYVQAGIPSARAAISPHGRARNSASDTAVTIDAMRAAPGTLRVLRVSVI